MMTIALSAIAVGVSSIELKGTTKANGFLIALT
ncbi:hypothetical protein CY0110_18397 [Crocosphaera chwakensis CCY0110]|uniref:Uncharacterized protein n=1 Tax=Crocosphaera chwakensis CCY0110 TaxID=391612 RepID=A3IJ11_9CHRO|nr:hypothetical protein CY0110_18397 [Crocosphaera chwakensis CCY0110]